MQIDVPSSVELESLAPQLSAEFTYATFYTFFANLTCEWGSGEWASGKGSGDAPCADTTESSLGYINSVDYISQSVGGPPSLPPSPTSPPPPPTSPPSPPAPPPISPPPLFPPWSPSREVSVVPGIDALQFAHDAASPGSVLVLDDGVFTSSSVDSVLSITKSITIRALNLGQAVVDGENARRGILITSGVVVLHGLNVTKGYVTSYYVGYVSCAGFVLRAHHSGRKSVPEHSPIVHREEASSSLELL